MPPSTKGDSPAKPLNFGRHIGIHFDKLEADASWLYLDLEPHHMNPYGLMHGGVPYSLADNGMGAIVYSMLAKGEACATIEIKMNYLKPASAGRLECETRLVRKGRSVAVLESRLRVNGEEVAIALGTYAIFPQRADITGPPRP